MGHFQYLLVMALCVAATLPLELAFGARVWRRPRRLVAVLAGPVLVFCAWDVAAIAHHHWHYAARYTTGVDLPGSLPIEELAFFVVVPICALLTFEVVTRMTGPDRDVAMPGRLVPALARPAPGTTRAGAAPGRPTAR